MQVERDVLPALHLRCDGIDRVGVVGAQEFQRLLGEHHAKAPGGAFGVLFEQVDMGVRDDAASRDRRSRARRALRRSRRCARSPPRLTVYLQFGSHTSAGRSAGASGNFGSEPDLYQVQRRTLTPFTTTMRQTGDRLAHHHGAARAGTGGANDAVGAHHGLALVDSKVIVAAKARAAVAASKNERMSFSRSLLDVEQRKFCGCKSTSSRRRPAPSCRPG